MSILSVENVTKRFGGLTAVNSVSLSVDAGEILSVIGPNGAGKSTLFKIIGSALAPTSGRVEFEGRTVSGLKPNVAAALGIVRTFQETTIFRDMTALQSVTLAHHIQLRAGFLGVYFSTPTARADEARFRQSSLEILDYLGLASIAHETARNLPHGHLRALGVAMALAARPKVLLLDEPFAGMNSQETDRAVGMVEGIRRRGVTILLVEHDMPAVMRISDRIVVMNYGAKIAEGLPHEIQRNPAVVEAYLGREDDGLDEGAAA
jgi:branched-chain amino acid transport system ATP-binding protein